MRFLLINAIAIARFFMLLGGVFLVISGILSIAMGLFATQTANLYEVAQANMPLEDRITLEVYYALDPEAKAEYDAFQREYIEQGVSATARGFTWLGIGLLLLFVQNRLYRFYKNVLKVDKKQVVAAQPVPVGGYPAQGMVYAHVASSPVQQYRAASASPLPMEPQAPPPAPTWQDPSQPIPLDELDG